ncbi:MAG: FAD-dependent monooxygenase [Gemmatimonadales bacterium]
MQHLPTSTAVAIVGAGPTGLTLACRLAADGIPFVVLDRLAQGANTSRAAVIHARTLEVLDRLDVTRRLMQEGLVVPTFTIRDRDRVLARVPFEWLPTPYPHTLMLPQQRTEAILLERLRALGGDVSRPYDMEGYEEVDGGVRLRVRGPDGARHDLTVAWLVGADGMHSKVREASGIGFVGGSYEESFVLADVRMSWPLPNDEVALFFSPTGLVVVAPLPEGHHRIVATCDPVPEHPDAGFMQALLDARGPVADRGRIRDIVWSSRFRLHHRVADRYRAGRVLLAGDAAHVHSPAGGQGMNTGIQDALALGDALADVVSGRSGESRLDDYEHARRPVAERVVRYTDRMTRVATLRTPRRRRVRNAVLSRAARLPAVQRRLALTLSGLHNR